MIAFFFCFVNKTKEYDKEKIYNELKWGIDALGGVQNFVRADEKILLKPNLLRKADRDSAIVTHPYVVGAVARIFKDSGCQNIKYGDSVGIGDMDKIARHCGLFDEMEALGIPMADFNECVKAEYPQGKMAMVYPQTRHPFFINWLFRL